jgi:hypothetical protein
MKDNDFVETISMVSYLVKETFALDDILHPDDFKVLWHRNKNKLDIDERIKGTEQGYLCFYNHYLMYKLIQKAQKRPELRQANDRHLRAV